ncbi:hypothetical protein [Archangium sp. Cb G35]|uniref:hypothetical protein n=1 Tax=Archangium sp. Cb G35 TaxID=1920190 RepID=UPI001160ED04|nr:hypothetical protein [Archangium sp. Cb G35]
MPPETPEPAASERPRLIINGEPFPPEDLCQSLSPSVLLRLSVTKEPYVPPEPRRPMTLPARVEALPARTLAVILVLLGLGLAALILL